MTSFQMVLEEIKGLSEAKKPPLPLATATRKQKENAIAGVLPKQNKRGRGAKRLIFFTGQMHTFLKSGNHQQWDSVVLTTMSDADIDDLYSGMVL